MRYLATFSFIVLFVFLAASPVSAQEAVGYSDNAVLLPDPTSNCTVGELTRNDDGSAENGYSWGFGGIVPPYYGAFGEAYDPGPGIVSCGAFWLTQVGYNWGRGMDVYVWDGGVTRDPDGVLFMGPGVVPTNIPYWPDCGQNDFPHRL